MKFEKLKREQPPLLSERLKAWSMALAAELSDWPQVTLKSFFGFTALYHGKTMFGLLPRTRSIFKGNAVAFRMEAANCPMQSLLEKDPRIAAFDKDKKRWFTFELSCDADLHEALDYLGRAFDAARIEGERRIQLRGEMLRTHKERVQRGEVRLRKDVITENQNVQVPVTREELVIERTPGSGRVKGEIGRDEEVRVPLSEERVRVEKQPVVNEEVRVGKRQVQRNKEVSDKVRHEELREEKQGDLDARETNPPGNRKNRVA